MLNQKSIGKFKKLSYNVFVGLYNVKLKFLLIVNCELSEYGSI
ncbi:hypothetical protein [uncultured Clostridium sp.]|uniref:Uncharacterized protein n=1 Tax=Clostridium lapidicellarium TaxID=3240931 RepID=A0ABV4DS55_9CLOT|nr:hypothetical protein [uncultured Clostridium sp.]